MDCSLARITKSFNHNLKCLAAFSIASISFATTPSLAEESTEEFPGNEFVKVRLGLETASIAPSGQSQLAVIFQISPGWHLYWRNPGDSGLPPRVTFQPVAGITFGEPIWPAPQRHVVADTLVHYIYERELVLMIPMAIDPEKISREPVTIAAQVDWLVCRDVCIPGRQKVSTTWPESAEGKRSGVADVLARARKRLPAQAAGDSSSLICEWGGLELRIRVKGASRLAFYPYENDDGTYPEDMLQHGVSRSESLRLRYPRDVVKLQGVEGVLAVTRNGVETYYELRIPPPAATVVRKANG